MRDVTTIKLNRKTKEMLANLGKKGDTYDEVVQRLIIFYMTKKTNIESIREA